MVSLKVQRWGTVSWVILTWTSQSTHHGQTSVELVHIPCFERYILTYPVKSQKRLSTSVLSEGNLFCPLKNKSIGGGKRKTPICFGNLSTQQECTDQGLSFHNYSCYLKIFLIKYFWTAELLALFITLAIRLGGWFRWECTQKIYTGMASHNYIKIQGLQLDVISSDILKRGSFKFKFCSLSAQMSFDYITFYII